MERYDRMANNMQARDLVYKFAAAMKKRAAMHATEAEQSERARTADPPATGGQVQQEVAKIEQAGMTPARELSPRLRKKKVQIPPGAFMSRQRVEGGMVKRYRP